MWAELHYDFFRTTQQLRNSIHSGGEESFAPLFSAEFRKIRRASQIVAQGQSQVLQI